MFPQCPQLVLSVFGFAHVAPHIMFGALHPHEPALHEIPLGQRTPHPPQFAGSLSVAMHVPPQKLVPGGQPHEPARHTVPPAQLLPHAPQFALSVVASTQRVTPALVHAIAGAVHAMAQCPLAHICPLGHATPHPPQLRESFCTSAHSVPQNMLIGAHAHTPD